MAQEFLGEVHLLRVSYEDFHLVMHAHVLNLLSAKTRSDFIGYCLPMHINNLILHLVAEYPSCPELLQIIVASGK